MDSPSGGSLADKLKSLGVKVGTTNLPAPPAESRYEIDTVVPGSYVPTRAGEIFISEKTYPIDHRHGDFPVGLSAPLSGMAAWASDPRLLEIAPEHLAFLDTETSGLAGGTGTYAFMVGAARYENGQFRLLQFFMRDPAEEPALLEGLADFLAPCNTLVTFNGKSFDAPLLTTRYTLHRIPNPFKDFSHIDLLPLARRLWRDRLPSRALKALEVDIMNAPRGEEEVPGYEIPFLYFDYLRTRDARPLSGVFYHNALDMLAMGALLNHTAGLLANPLHADLAHGLDVIALGKLFEDIGRWDDAAILFERGLQMNLPPADFGTATRRLSTLQRRRGDLTAAIKLWEQAAAEGHIYAHIELAKYHEHTARDIATALQHARTAFDLTLNKKIPLHERIFWQNDLLKRTARLETRLKKKS